MLCLRGTSELLKRTAPLFNIGHGFVTLSPFLEIGCPHFPSVYQPAYKRGRLCAYPSAKPAKPGRVARRLGDATGD